MSVPQQSSVVGRICMIRSATEGCNVRLNLAHNEHPRDQGSSNNGVPALSLIRSTSFCAKTEYHQS